MIIWLASYPKSGNTWVRSFLSAYYYSHDGKFDFKLLEKIRQFPSRDFLSQKLKSVDEAAENWLIAQKKINDQNEFCFLKTHNVYGAYKGKSFTTPDFTLGAIYIVRDPRNVLTSLMNHYSLTEDDALKMINSIYRNLRDENDNYDFSSYSFISSWANNYKSWKMSKNINKLIINDVKTIQVASQILVNHKFNSPDQLFHIRSVSQLSNLTYDISPNTGKKVHTFVTYD